MSKIDFKTQIIEDNQPTRALNEVLGGPHSSFPPTSHLVAHPPFHLKTTVLSYAPYLRTIYDLLFEE